MGMAYTGEPPPTRWKWRMLPKLRRWFLDDGDKLIKIRSLRLHRGQYGWEGPCMLVDKHRLNRMTVWPVWDSMRLLAPFRDKQS